MNKLEKKNWFTLALCLLAILGVLFIFSFFTPIYGEICSKNEYTYAKECSTHHIALVAFWQIIKAANDWSAAIIALFTVILGFATWALWGATRNLVKGADETAQHQLRGYLGIENTSLNLFPPNNESFSVVTIKNFGRTPMKKLQVTWRLWLENVQTREILSEIRAQEESGYLAPAQTLTFFMHEFPVVTPEQSAMYNAGTISFKMTGRIDCFDVFGAKRWLKFGTNLHVRIHGQTRRSIHENIDSENDCN